MDVAKILSKHSRSSKFCTRLCMGCDSNPKTWPCKARLGGAGQRKAKKGGLGKEGQRQARRGREA